jgi:hypothetical protein
MKRFICIKKFCVENKKFLTII